MKKIWKEIKTMIWDIMYQQHYTITFLIIFGAIGLGLAAGKISVLFGEFIAVVTFMMVGAIDRWFCVNDVKIRGKK